MDDTGADTSPGFHTSLTGLSKKDWLDTVAAIVDEDGTFEHLGDHHFAAFAEEGSTLLVTFETLQGMQALSERTQPFGWEMLEAQGWSSLCIASDGDTWFRDPHVYAYFDRLIDDGFFDDFETVLFYGAGPCGYAAGAFSVASPGARVVLIQPQATLDPRITEWDPRFSDMRRLDFNSRYGFAPDMLDAAKAAYVLYDPRDPLDAMHAALFTRPNVVKLRMPFMGAALQTDLMDMNKLAPLLEHASEDTLHTESFAKLYRARRTNRAYLRNLLSAVESADHPQLVEQLLEYGVKHTEDGRFVRKLRRLQDS